MEYQVENNKLYKFNENIIVASFYPSSENFTTDETGWKLIEALKPTHFEKINVSDIKATKNEKAAIIKTIDKARPKLNCDDMINEFKIDVKNLKIAKEFTDKKVKGKPTLAGVYVNAKGTIIATDSFKLFAIDKGDDEQSIVLPVEFIEELDNEEAVITFNKYVACVTTEHKTVWGRLLNGEYPASVTKMLRGIEWQDTADFKLFSEEIKIGRLVGVNAVITCDKEANTVIFADTTNSYEGTNYIKLNGKYLLSNIETIAKYLDTPQISCGIDKAPAKFKEDDKIFLICQMSL